MLYIGEFPKPRYVITELYKYLILILFCSGVNVIGILESLGISETLLEPLKKSGAGYFALAFALYKLVTPLRYAVTVGKQCFSFT